MKQDEFTRKWWERAESCCIQVYFETKQKLLDEYWESLQPKTKKPKGFKIKKR